MKNRNVFLTLLLAASMFQACSNGTATNDTAGSTSPGNAGGNTDAVEKAKDINENNKTVKEDDAKFMTKAASGGMMEVQLGQIAQQKAKDQRVKNFGAMMVRDHTKANDELKALAATKNIALPTALSDDHQKHVNDMEKMTGADFDKHYISMMVDDHKEDIGDFEKASGSAADADIKAFASKTLPVLRTHLDSANAIHNKK